MFNLEQSISGWRQQMLAAGIQSPAPLEELEIHLHEEIERQIRSGMNDQRAFETAVRQIGQAEPLKAEFKKIEAENWNRPLAWLAWTSFAISFFLPAYGDGAGWRCAGLSASAFSWADTWHGNWFAIHLAALTLANVLMISSPFLLAGFAANARFMKWLRFSTFAALALVWSFLLLLITHKDGSDLRIGCYVWGTSFLPLWLSALNLPGLKRRVPGISP
jgi:hypothetical protein